MTNWLETTGSFLTFAGGVWLSIDAFMIRKHIRSQSGAARLLKILKHADGDEVLTDEHNRPLKSETALQLWFAARTIAWNWVALGFMTTGFLLDLIGKFTS